MQHRMPRLIAVAHGTASEAGSRTTSELIDAIAAARPSVQVEVAFLDVAAPTLPAVLAGGGPAFVVPMLLSTGYHVQADIPAAVTGRVDVAIARHLGPHPLLVDALIDRLPPVDGAASVALVGAGSTRPEAAAELGSTARLLGARLRRPVVALTVGDELTARLRALPAPVVVATYLLAEGRFVSTLHAALDGIGAAGDPIGVHPALVDLVWTRYDEAVAAVR